MVLKGVYNRRRLGYIADTYTKPSIVPMNEFDFLLSFDIIYNLEAVAALLKIFIGLALVHFQKYWLLRVSNAACQKSTKNFEVKVS